LKIQDGCNYGCSFCTIPLARGRSRSAKPTEVLSNLNELIQKGSKEVVLSGINIGDYGIIEGKRSNNFYSLLQIINNEIKNIRLRISSIEPNLLSNEIIELISESEIFVNHFHIPLQSGSNKILNGMSRRYTNELYEDRVNYIKKLMPDSCIGGDVIVGFPGEDSNEFDKTLKFIKNLDISYLHVFPYSERSNTRAISLNESVPIEIRNERSKVLRLLSDKKKRYFYESNLDNVRNVLFENKVNSDYIYGFTDNYIKTKVKFNKDLVGKKRNILLKKVDNDLSVIGEII
jgi:threonylcarbamoyladenosine tRNA methylthiotransferase MtaB